MQHTPRTRWQLRLLNISFVLLFLVAVGLLQWVSREYRVEFDLTQSRRHSLSPASRAILERLKEPLKITAFSSQRGETRRVIQELVGRYQKVKADIVLEYVDPDVDPEQVRAAGVQYEGELILSYGPSTEHLRPPALTEEAVTNALTRLGRRGERWLVFLSGHGERSPDRQANFDLSTWAAQLRARGFRTRVLILSEQGQIPQNATAVIIAGPRSRLLPGEIKEIEAFVARGGNLLWLSDPGALHGLERLAELLGVEFQPGVVIDPTSEAIVGSPSAIIVARYGAHPVVRNFANFTVFPHASALAAKAAEGWTAAVLLDTRNTAWSETGPLNQPLTFDPGRDIAGPLNLGIALTREHEGKQQRIAVVGDGDFLSNSIIANGGNLDLGMSLANWISQDDAYVSIPVSTARDRTLSLTRQAEIAIGGGFLVILPLLFAASGLVIWLRRRRR